MAKWANQDLQAAYESMLPDAPFSFRVREEIQAEFPMAISAKVSAWPVLLGLLAISLCAADDAPRPDPAQQALTPEPRADKLYLHQAFLGRVAQGEPVDVLFLGDSITDRWPRVGECSWLKLAAYHPANFGVGGDRTEHVIWRLANGELENIRPKVVVILIGTNNAGRDEPEWTAAGVAKIVEMVRRKLPDAKILLLAIFPRDARDSPSRRKNAAVNALIARLADGKHVRFLDIGPVFLDAKGDIPKEVMPDGLHPGPKGYDLWFRALQPVLDELTR